MIEVHFFAQIREYLDTPSLNVNTSGPCSVADIKGLLAGRGERWQILASDQVLAAVNQVICDDGHTVRSGDEVAFFPPVTGG